MTARKPAAKAALPQPAAKKSASAKAANPVLKAATKKAAKAIAAPEPKPAAKPAAKPAVDPGKAAKPKLVRDSFTMPKAEYAAIDLLKQRAAKLARPAKKSELLRAGVKALSALSDKALLAALAAVPTIKTGRPNKD